MATLRTRGGDYEVSAEEWRRVEKMRSSLAGTMRRAYQMQQKWMGTRYLLGDAHPATAERKAQLAACEAKVGTRTAELRAVLERIERECPKVTAA